jgi:glycosyltransferase involved in cell wall biosynthesis
MAMAGGNKSSVLMLSADPPGLRAGGEIRTYHVARALAARTRLTLAILLSGDKTEVPADLAESCAALHRTDRDFLVKAGRRDRKCPKMMTRLIPWLISPHELLSQARRHCATRPEYRTKTTYFKRFALSVYRILLEVQVAFAYGLFNVAPSRTAERLLEFQNLFPELKANYPPGSFDTIWIEHSFLFPFVPEIRSHFGPVPVICNAHNVEYDYHRRMAGMLRTASARRWWLRQSKVMKRHEAKGFDQAALTFCCSAEDLRLVREISPLARVEVLPNGVDTDYFTNTFRRSAEPSVVYTGGMSYAPNQDAVEHFAGEILPLIRASVPNCRFVVAGSSAGGRFSQWEEKDSLFEVASDVPDIRQYIGGAWVVVVPLRVGSGTRLKVLEAMAMEKAIVSTPIGAEGIEYAAGGNIELAEFPKAFAEAVIALIENPDESIRMGKRARTVVCDRYDWRILCDRAMTTLYQTGLAGNS